MKSSTLLCTCRHAGLIPEAVLSNILNAFNQAGWQIDVVDDLCGMAARKSSVLQNLIDSEPLIIAACFPRAVRYLFERADAPLPSHASLLNLRTGNPELLTQQLLKTASRGPQVSHQAPADDSWIPWYPVIDTSRCINCKQCLNFCLFGVYALDSEGNVHVTTPTACKTNCPACAKMCPQGAIIFPKHPEPPINGADEESGATHPQANPFAAMEGNDIHAMLRNRSANAFGIPQSVLDALSPDECAALRQRAEGKKNEGGAL